MSAPRVDKKDDRHFPRAKRSSFVSEGRAEKLWEASNVEGEAEERGVDEGLG